MTDNPVLWLGVGQYKTRQGEYIVPVCLEFQPILVMLASKVPE